MWSRCHVGIWVSGWFALLVAGAVLAGGTPAPYDVRPYLMQAPVGKPSKPAQTGDDSCRWAKDNECDEPGIGTGACPAGTDYSDCWRIAQGIEDDSCQWAHDGECDEPGFGSGACTQGTDATDCGAVAHLRFRKDTCVTAFDGVCNEPETGDGTCEARTDRADCVGRARPMTITDHFFGHDDRRIMDTAQFPWRAIGILSFDAGGNCSGTLVAPDVVLTAAHCLYEEATLAPAGTFTAGRGREEGPLEARIVTWYMDPARVRRTGSGPAGPDPLDWALVRLDAPIGDTLGYVGVRRGARVGTVLSQAGYSWDTGDALSGHVGCQVLRVQRGNTLAHDCDTTRGDSGSPLMVRDGEGYYIVAVDSRLDRKNDGKIDYVAVRSEAWSRAYERFVSGHLTGTRVTTQKEAKVVP